MTAYPNRIWNRRAGCTPFLSGLVLSPIRVGLLRQAREVFEVKVDRSGQLAAERGLVNLEVLRNLRTN